MIGPMVQGIQLVMHWNIWGLMLLAIILGNFFGAVPGLGGNIGLALLIPLVFGMHPFAGLAFLLAMHAVVHTGGAIPAILFGIPGNGPNAATVVDGYPMTRNGNGGRALGASLTSSAVGGIIGAVVLALMIPFLRPIAMALGSAEIFAMIVFGLTFIVSVSRSSLMKGALSAFLGLSLGMVGLDPRTGVGRFTFGQLWLWNGLSIVTIVLGIFAFAEIISLGTRGRSAQIAAGGTQISRSELWDGVKDVFRHWWLTLRTAVIGAFIGMIPGLGGDAASWICYGHAAQTCRDNEMFGQGDVRGVIGVESAQNAKEGGALLPTVVFGIPGSSGMAILLGAFLILGIEPGPGMITQHLSFVWGMVWVLVIANVMTSTSLLLLPVCQSIGKLAYFRSSLLIPGIITVAGIGAYLIRGHWQDVILTIAIGFVGYMMKKFDYPRGPLILGFILGPLAEGYFYKSMGVYGIDFVKRPLVLTFFSLAALSLCFSCWSTYREKTAERRLSYEVER